MIVKVGEVSLRLWFSFSLDKKHAMPVCLDSLTSKMLLICHIFSEEVNLI